MPTTGRMIEDNAALLGIPITIFETDIFESVYNVEKNRRATSAPGCAAATCTASRRSWAAIRSRWGTIIDDVIETMLMGMLYGAQIQSHDAEAAQHELPRHGADPPHVLHP